MIDDFFELVVDRATRYEGAEECALRLSDMLGELGDMRPAFSRMIVQRDNATGRSARWLPSRAEDIRYRYPSSSSRARAS